MRKSTLVGGLAAALASMVLVLPPPAVSAQTGGGGGGTGDLYSDLYVVLRDVNGVPELTTETFYEEGGTVTSCVQPISYDVIPGITAEPNGADGRMVYLVPLVGEGSDALTPVADDTACDPDPLYLDYVSEVELERMNLVRTSEAVLWKKLTDVGIRLAGADRITLDGAGRITTWTGTPSVPSAIDASPDQAAIYSVAEGDNPAPPPVVDGRPGAAEPGGLMDTGTIPHWTTGVTTPAYPLSNPALIEQGSGGFDNWELAAAAIGTAASKPVPITVDTIQYYNRIASPEADALVEGSGGVGDWTYAPVLEQTANGEEFVDYANFSYTRSEVFQGCTTWLDVPTLTWKYDDVVNRVVFTDIVSGASTGPVTNIAGFAQLADDVRSVINYLHENEVVVDPVTGEGFFIDPVFEESCEVQAAMVDTLNENSDRADLTVTITSKPVDGTSDTSATFEFEPVIASIWIGPDVDFYCDLDGLGVVPCTSPVEYTDLAVGDHTFTVFATAGGTAGLSTAYTWTVVPPDLAVTITSAPAELTYDTSATFGFTAVEPGLDFYCELDELGLVPCTSPVTYADLAVGEHTFTVSATDGVTAGLPTTYTWTVLVDPPASGWPDFGGDGLADRSVFRPEVGGWYVDGATTVFYGLAADVPVPADYDGDGVTDRAVFRDGAWLIEGQATRSVGLVGDVPVPGDYDGDGDWEPAVFRDGAWFIEGQATQYWGAASDVPVPGDYDGDGTTEVAVFRPSVGGWYVDGETTVFYGLSADVPVPADYNGDGTTDRAVFRLDGGGWYVDGLTTEFVGLATDVPVPADYNGDGSAERAVYRPQAGGWFVQGETTVFYGLPTDVPLPLPAAVYNTYFTVV